MKTEPKFTHNEKNNREMLLESTLEYLRSMLSSNACILPIKSISSLLVEDVCQHSMEALLLDLMDSK